MSVLWLVVGLVAVQRMAELAYAGRNTRRLLAEGGREIGARHYPLVVALHAAWLAALVVFVPADAAVNWALLAAFIALQGARLWVMASLGRYWTTRIVSHADRPLVRRGPYRFMRHPNYAIVVAEIALLPLVFGAWKLALVFSVLNALLIGHRIRVEDRALAPRRETARSGS